MIAYDVRCKTPNCHHPMYMHLWRVAKGLRQFMFGVCRRECGCLEYRIETTLIPVQVK